MSHKAWQNAHAMYENDACAKALGIDIISMDEGFAVVTMTVTAQMLNGHQSCHGGQLFSLADTAFAYACNKLLNWRSSRVKARVSSSPSPANSAAYDKKLRA
jgi:acyl-coenzyme A thioesterase PaaI-like protein